MTEEYSEKDFVWERGLFRAPNSILLLNVWNKYYLIPCEKTAKRVRREKKFFRFLNYTFVFICLSHPVWIPIAFSYGGFTALSLLAFLTLSSVVGFLIYLFSEFYLRRNLEKVKVTRAGLIGRLKRDSQQHNIIVWLIIFLLLGSNLLLIKNDFTEISLLSLMLLFTLSAIFCKILSRRSEAKK